MRTTVNLEDDILRIARALARERGDSLGTVLSDLARKGLRPQVASAYEGDFPVFQVREDTPPLTSEMVEGAMEDD